MDSVSQVRTDAVLRITLQRPEKRNAINDALAESALAAFQDGAQDPSVSVVVLDGAGGTLSAGADLSGGIENKMDDYSEQPLARLLRAVCLSPVPVIAVVDGYALGAGLGLAGAATFAVATPRSTFGLPEAPLGFFPFGVVPHLTARVRPHVVLEWALTGRRFGIDEAVSAGIVTHVAEESELAGTVDSLAAGLCTVPGDMVRTGMRWYHAERDLAPPAEVLDFCEREIGNLRKPSP